MKKHVKYLATALAATISATALASCKKKVANNENTLEIYAADFGYGYEWLSDAAELFKQQDWVKEKYPELSIPAIRHNSERSYAVDRIQAGDSNTIDLFFSVQSGASVYEQTFGNNQAYFADLSDVYAAAVPGENVTVAQKMDDNFLKMNTYTKKDGSAAYYSFPWVAGMQGLLYNKTLCDENGVSVPNTTDELAALCDVLAAKNVTPFIFTSKENYWTCMLFLIWWAQYEGLENYGNFYQGLVEEDGIKTMSVDVFKQTGRLRSLEVIENLIYYPEHSKNIHADVNTLSFTQAQAKFLLRQGAMMPNGDWFETEMTKTRENDGITDVFTFMKTPVISSIVETLENKSMTDAQLSAVIAAIDNGEESYAGVSENDFAKIKQARNIVLPVGNHVAMIPGYSTAKDLAKDFLIFLATDTANESFIRSTNGASAPFKYDVEEKNPALYESLPQLQKTRLTLQKNALYMLNENTYAGVYYGGIARFTESRTNVESLFTARNASDRMTAREIYQAEIDHWDTIRWNSVLTNMGLK
ncbi:MAG: ABC transporter substrate-binding protein [Candidatus Scatosoma sp.]